MVKTLFKCQDPENHTLLSGTYPSRPNKGVLPLTPPSSVQVAIFLKLEKVQTSKGK